MLNIYWIDVFVKTIKIDMRTVRLISVLMASVLLFTGCDFFRSLVGKPTSEDMERMRLEAQLEAQKKKEQDSIARVNAMLEEEQRLLAQQNSLENTGRYHVVMGSFKVPENAQKMKQLLENKGYTSRIIQFNNGFDVVSAAHFNKFIEAVRTMDELIELEICPDDIWVYDRTKNLHKQ